MADLSHIQSKNRKQQQHPFELFALNSFHAFAQGQGRGYLPHWQMLYTLQRGQLIIQERQPTGHVRLTAGWAQGVLQMPPSPAQSYMS